MTDEEVLAELRIAQEQAIANQDRAFMVRLIETYYGLGYECNAANLERRVEYMKGDDR